MHNKFMFIYLCLFIGFFVVDIFCQHNPKDLQSRYGFVFGSNSQYQLGIQTNSSINSYIGLHPHVSNLFSTLPVVNISNGVSHTIALTEWGSVYSWGTGHRGELGIVSEVSESPGMLTSFDEFSNIDLLGKRVSQVDAGAHHNIALIGDYVFTWGDNKYKQLGAPIPSIVTWPTEVVNWTAPIPANYSSTSNTTFIRKSQRVNCTSCRPVVENFEFTSSLIWASGIKFQLGIKLVRAKMFRSVALTIEGTVWVWGDNRDGLIGIASEEDSIYPSKIESGFKVAQDVCLGSDFFVVLDESNRVWVWGDNHRGQLGLGDGAPKTVGSPVENPYFREKNITHISCGYQHVILRSEKQKRVYAFGDNEYGQLGLNNFDSHNCPQEIEYLRGFNIASLTTGRGHNILLTKTSGIFVWGLNNQGQLGIGDTTTRPHPTRLVSLEALGLRVSSAGYASSFVWTGHELEFPENTYEPPKTGALIPMNANRNLDSPE